MMNNNVKEWDICDQPIIYGEWLESKKDIFIGIDYWGGNQWGCIGWRVDEDDYYDD